MNEPTKTVQRCSAKTRSGAPCRKFPLAGKNRCRLHGGLSTGPRTREGKARIAAAQLKHGRYVNWRERREKEKAYYKQIRLVMRQARKAGLIED
ncbi:MAG: HGGxSTG domain-containing protein [Pseudomonadota bacterium]|nr:HGGxSTG domain-containing protein [Pseudomonadota bacterium]